MVATDKVFLWSAAIFVVCALMVWLAPRPKRVATGGGH
jgi:hypothetical protein